jgi:hypothetical protein
MKVRIRIGLKTTGNLAPGHATAHRTLIWIKGGEETGSRRER